MNIQLRVTLTVSVPLTVATLGIKDNYHSLFVNDEIHIFVVHHLTARTSENHSFVFVAWLGAQLLLFCHRRITVKMLLPLHFIYNVPFQTCF